MIKIDTEVIVALIGMAATAWAPTVTAYVTRDKELRLKKLEIYQQCKKEAYVNFSIAYSKTYRLLQPDLDDAVKELITASHQVLMYCSSSTSDKVVELIDFANSFPLNDSERAEEFKTLLYEVMHLLNREIQQDSE